MMRAVPSFHADNCENPAPNFSWFHASACLLVPVQKPLAEVGPAAPHRLEGRGESSALPSF